MNPTASAPMATASSASSSLVIPQILTNMERLTVPVQRAAASRFIAEGLPRLSSIGMGRLDDIDLTARLAGPTSTRSAWRRRRNSSSNSASTLGGQIGDERIGPGLLVVVEGVDAGRQGWRRPPDRRADSTHATISVYAYSKPDRARASATTSSGGSGARSPAWAGCACSTAAGTAGCSSNASRGSPPSSSGCGPTTRSSSSRRASSSKA